MRTMGSSPRGGWCFPAALATACLVLGAIGCADRTLTITCERYINTGLQSTGSPLAVDIVSVLPAKDQKCDVQKEANKDLLPGSGITADVWFARRPTKESMTNKEDVSRFRVHRSQILSFTDKAKTDKDFYGTWKGGQILGKEYWSPGQESIIVKGIPAADVFDENAVIYVFCKFTDGEGRVKKSKPAVFHKVGHYTRDLHVHIGAEGVEVRSTKKLGSESGKAEQ